MKLIGRRALTPAQKQQRYRDGLKAKQAQAEKDAAYARARAKREAAHARLATVSTTTPGTRYPLVVMDPGTMFNTRSERGMNRSNPANHYITNTWEQVAANVPPLHDDALLLCWCTQANAHIMMRIVEGWGLTIKSLFTWDKTIIGMGYWGRSQYEYLIVATRGRHPPRVPLPSDRTPNGLIEKARRGEDGHSRKPEAFYLWVEEHWNLPKLEMQCRHPREGWDTRPN